MSCPGEENDMDEKDARIRWTVTGEGVPAGDRKETWTALLALVGHAERLGLRVAVAELEEDR